MPSPIHPEEEALATARRNAALPRASTVPKVFVDELDGDRALAHG
jgi:hypothetical protein